MLFDFFVQELEPELLALNPVAVLDRLGLLEAWLLLRPNPDSALSHRLERADKQAFGRRTYLSGPQIREMMRASDEDIEVTVSWLRSLGLEVLETDVMMRCIKVRGNLECWSKAVNVELFSFEFEGRAYCGNKSDAKPGLADKRVSAIVQDVIGFSDFVNAVEKMLKPDQAPLSVNRRPPSIQRGRYAPSELAERYRFPSDYRGRGQKIGIWSLGGGVHFSEIEEYARRHSPTFKPRKQIAFVGPNRPGPFEPLRDAVVSLWGHGERAMSDIDVVWTIETTLDIELLAGLADQAEIVVFSPETSAQSIEKTIVDTLKKIVEDDRRAPSIIAASWAIYETGASPGFAAYLDHWLEVLTKLRGTTFLFSSGNWGAFPDKEGEPTLGFPASSPHVLGCGGTSLPTDSKNGFEKEHVWNEVFKNLHMASTGGFSGRFPRPAWQERACSPHGRAGRGVPDLAANTDFRQGVHLLIGGVDVGSAGTSSASQIWAALLSRINQALGFPVGYLNPTLYQLPDQAFHSVERGRNNRFGHDARFTAQSGWDPCSGWGAPNGAALLSALKSRRIRQVGSS